MSESSAAEVLNFSTILSYQPTLEEGVGPELEPLRTLMCAMLVRAIEDFQASGQLRRDAARYIFDGTDKSEDYMFSFKNVCETLRLDAAKLRRELLNLHHKVKFRRRVNTDRVL